MAYAVLQWIVASLNYCDQIWRNFATLGKILKIFDNFSEGLSSIW